MTDRRSGRSTGDSSQEYGDESSRQQQDQDSLDSPPENESGRQHRGQGKPDHAAHREPAHSGRSSIAAGKVRLAGSLRVERCYPQATQGERQQHQGKRRRLCPEGKTGSGQQDTRRQQPGEGEAVGDLPEERLHDRR